MRISARRPLSPESDAVLYKRKSRSLKQFSHAWGIRAGHARTLSRLCLPFPSNRFFPCHFCAPGAKKAVMQSSWLCYVIEFLGEGFATHVDGGIHEVFATTGDVIAVAVRYRSDQAVSAQ
jgi:hypothetical protein